jgi:hypothetical protein
MVCGRDGESAVLPIPDIDASVRIVGIDAV